MGRRSRAILDRRISRAKKCHAIITENGDPEFWSYDMTDIIEWCLVREINELKVDTEKGSYLLRFWPLTYEEAISNG